VDGEVQVVEVRLTGDGGDGADQGSDQILDQGVDHPGEGGADDHGDGQVEQVSPQEELLDSFSMEPPPGAGSM
jgi:hypothetical protein